MRPPRVMIAINTTWNVVNFRAGLVRALCERGCEVIALTPPDDHVSRLESLGVRHIPIHMQAQGTSPVADLRLFARYQAVLRAERPDVFLGYTIKPNLYGSMAAHLAGVPVINTITGLGTAFLRAGWMTRVVRVLYRLALSRSRRVLFQNGEDRDLFTSLRLVAPARTGLVAGSGVDLSRFPPSPPAPGRPFRFLMVARLLGDKGVREYAEAARIVKAAHAGVEVMLMGGLDPRNPDSIAPEELRAWTEAGVLVHIPPGDTVAREMADADCVVLPSYREGAPRTLIEASAIGRPLVATDVTGCREVVEAGVTGFFCRPRDAADLARAMLQVVALDVEERLAMGRRSRARAEREFDERRVIARYLEEIDAIVARPKAGASRPAPSGAAR